jgi:hypothetical protein
MVIAEVLVVLAGNNLASQEDGNLEKTDEVAAVAIAENEDAQPVTEEGGGAIGSDAEDNGGKEGGTDRNFRRDNECDEIKLMTRMVNRMDYTKRRKEKNEMKRNKRLLDWSNWGGEVTVDENDEMNMKDLAKTRDVVNTKNVEMDLMMQELNATEEEEEEEEEESSCGGSTNVGKRDKASSRAIAAGQKSFPPTPMASLGKKRRWMAKAMDEAEERGSGDTTVGDHGTNHGLTVERIDLLNAIGLTWRVKMQRRE